MRCSPTRSVAPLTTAATASVICFRRLPALRTCCRGSLVEAVLLGEGCRVRPPVATSASRYR
jgi:hypothetical protein